jgi:hypothetical protein
MPTLPARRGRVAVIGGGPAGMATALSVRQAGHDVAVFERYHEARPAGSLLNLWPPPIKALRAMGVDTTDFGAPCRTEFRNTKGTFADMPGVERGLSILTHSRDVQGSWTAIRNKGRDGFQWWVLEAVDPAAPPPADIRDHARSRTQGSSATPALARSTSSWP